MASAELKARTLLDQSIYNAIVSQKDEKKKKNPPNKVLFFNITFAICLRWVANFAQAIVNSVKCEVCGNNIYTYHLVKHIKGAFSITFLELPTHQNRLHDRIRI